MNEKFKAIGIILVFLKVGLSGCQDISETINPPSIVVSSKSSSEGLEGPNRVGYVLVTVTNNGGEGRGTVNVKVSQGSNYWTKDQQVYLKNGESESITFRFEEILFWTSDPWNYTVWIS